MGIESEIGNMFVLVALRRNIDVWKELYMSE